MSSPLSSAMCLHKSLAISTPELVLTTAPGRPSCLGHNGIGKMNENGQRLLQLCCHHNLYITDTYFKTKPHHRLP